jgi:preprotein translocase subunit SecG
MTSALFITQIVLAILIVIVVMLQKSSSIGLGAYSGSNESLFGAKGPAGFLTKATFILGLLFIVNTLYLGYIYSKESTKSAVDTINKVAPAPKTTTAPAAPFKVEKKAASSDANATQKASEPKAQEGNKTETTKEANSTK